MSVDDSRVSLTSGLALSVHEQGAPSEPALVLLPGPTDSWRSYGPVLTHIPTSVRTIAVSPRGHGDSEKPAAGYEVVDLAAEVTELLDALGITRAVLVGHSGSSLVARRVAMDHPERVAGLVLEASPSTLRDHPGLAELVDGVSTLEDPIDPEFIRSFVVDTASPSVEAALLDELVREVAKVPAHVWRQIFAALLRYDDLRELERIAAPTLLIWGDADALVDRAMQDDLLERLPRATLVVYPGVGHTPRWEDAGRFAADVAAFVRRVTDADEFGALR
jgi:pimeloyl-ACP methyl ester carboxylesterase